VMVSHQPEILERYCAQAAVLCDGTLHFFDTLEEAKYMYDYAS
jgi:capsular polysaccharide transport system ATP-binding protein